MIVSVMLSLCFGFVGVFFIAFYSMMLYKRACAGGSSAGCMNLGDMYAKGIGMIKNKKKALSFYGRACDIGFQEGCELYNQYTQ